MGKSDANECNESSLSNCRVQLALSTKKDGMILEQYLYDEKAYRLKEQYDGTDFSDSMVPIPPLPLFQTLSVIILKPVSQRFLKTPLKLITAVLQLLTTDISRNLEFLHSRRTDTHW